MPDYYTYNTTTTTTNYHSTYHHSYYYHHNQTCFSSVISRYTCLAWYASLYTVPAPNFLMATYNTLITCYCIIRVKSYPIAVPAGKVCIVLPLGVGLDVRSHHQSMYIMQLESGDIS